jgi:predicted nucleic acid-binding protein
MRTHVLDACVVAKLVFPESGSEEAEELVRFLGRNEAGIHCPDLLFLEVASIGWKKLGKGECTARELHEILQVVDGLALDSWADRDLLPAALIVAIQTGTTVYDGLYVALAMQLDGVLVTADRRLAAAAVTTLGADRVRRIPSESPK